MDCFSGGEDTNLLFNYFEVSNERIRETGMRNSAVKCGEKTVSYREEDMYAKFNVRPPHEQ